MKENFILVLYYRCQLSYFQSNNNLVLSLVNQNKHVQVALLGGRLATKGADILKQVRSFREMATKDLGVAAADAWASDESIWTKALTKMWYRVGCSALSLKRYQDAEESLGRAAALSGNDKVVKSKLAEAKAHVKRIAKKQMSQFQHAFGK